MTAAGLPRLPHKAATKAKIAAKLRGRKRPPEVRAAISAGLRGKRRSPETQAKLDAARLARPPLLEQARAITKARQAREAAEHHDKWIADQRAAIRAGNMRLYRDVKRSKGWACNRKMLRPKLVSNGAVPKTSPYHKRWLKDIIVERMLYAFDPVNYLRDDHGIRRHRS